MKGFTDGNKGGHLNYASKGTKKFHVFIAFNTMNEKRYIMINTRHNSIVQKKGHNTFWYLSKKCFICIIQVFVFLLKR